MDNEKDLASPNFGSAAAGIAGSAAMAQAAREEVELLKARIDALEGKAGEPVTKSVKTPKAKVNEPLARSIEGVAPVADDNE